MVAEFPSVRTLCTLSPLPGVVWQAFGGAACLTSDRPQPMLSRLSPW